MQLTPTLTPTLIIILLSLAFAIIPTALAATWNSHLELFDLGLLPSDPDHPDTSELHISGCGDIPFGGYGCGSFESDGVVALRAIYRCVLGDKLIRVDLCDEKTAFNRCVKNQRHGGQKIFDYDSTEKVVCAEKRVVDGD